MAIDVALLLPAGLHDTLTALNRTLHMPPSGFRFNSTHLPHLTLVQLFARLDDLERIAAVIDGVVRHQAALDLVTAQIACTRASSTLAVGQTDALTTLHRRLMNGLTPFRSHGGGTDAFWTDGDVARTADIEWVARFHEQSAFERFAPHITLGVGRLITDLDPISFVATRLALCRLGRFCTCRQVLTEWTLTAPK